MIPKVHLKELWKVTMRRSTLITIPNLVEFFNFNNEFSQWEVWYQIVRDALDKFELYYPLFRVQKTYLKIDPGTRMAQLTDNFEGWLNGVMTEDQIFLKPSSVIGLSLNSTVGSIYPLRDYKYDGNTGHFTDIWYATNTFWMGCLCKRPFPELFEDNGEPKDNCCVFFMDKDHDATYKYFKDQLYCELCRYIWNMKMNMQLSNLPIDVFQGLQDDSSRVQSDLDKVYDGALTASNWLM